jgi:PAS domain-containing protein
LRRKDGSEIVVLENARTLYDESGNAIGHEGTLSDITERKRAELEVHSQRERAQVTLNSIADGVITTDNEGRIDYLNPVAETLTGWRLAEARGRPVREVIMLRHETKGSHAGESRRGVPARGQDHGGGPALRAGVA